MIHKQWHMTSVFLLNALRVCSACKMKACSEQTPVWTADLKCNLLSIWCLQSSECDVGSNLFKKCELTPQMRRRTSEEFVNKLYDAVLRWKHYATEQWVLTPGHKEALRENESVSWWQKQPQHIRGSGRRSVSRCAPCRTPESQALAFLSSLHLLKMTSSS